jgi:hypothetical protein
MGGVATSVLGLNVSSATSEQTNLSDISQSYSGTCAINCSNSIGDINYIFKDSSVDDIEFTQACTLDANCLIAANVATTTDLLAKAQNSAAIKDAAKAFVDISGASANISNTSTRQNNIVKIRNAVNEQCTEGTINSMGNFNILADGSTLHKIKVAQTGEGSGRCGLDATMNATAHLMSESDNASTIDRGKGTFSFAGVIAAIVIFCMIMGAFAYFKSKKGTAPGLPSLPGPTFANLPSPNLFSGLASSLSGGRSTF